MDGSDREAANGGVLADGLLVGCQVNAERPATGPEVTERACRMSWKIACPRANWDETYRINCVLSHLHPLVTSTSQCESNCMDHGLLTQGCVGNLSASKARGLLPAAHQHTCASVLGGAGSGTHWSPAM